MSRHVHVQAPPGAAPVPVFHTSPGATQTPVVLTRPGATKASESVDTAGVDRKTNCVTKNFQERSGTKAFVSEHQKRRQNKNEDKFLDRSKEKRIYLYLNYRRNE